LNITSRLDNGTATPERSSNPRTAHSKQEPRLHTQDSSQSPEPRISPRAYNLMRLS